MAKKTFRYHSSLAFPPYAFLPGRNLHPNGEGGYRFQNPDPKPLPIQADEPFQSAALRFALDLFNHQFFWESHIFSEALWNAHDRSGNIAHFLKAMIKLAAAGVKVQLQEWKPAAVHLKSARELFLQLETNEGKEFLGFSLSQIVTDVQKTLATIETHSPTGTAPFFEIHPKWK